MPFRKSSIQFLVTRIRGERDSFAESNLQAKLSAGDVFTSEKYKISKYPLKQLTLWKEWRELLCCPLGEMSVLEIEYDCLGRVNSQMKSSAGGIKV
jgi:hypothetical protein